MTYLDEFFEGWAVIKKIIANQEYEIPRDGKTSKLSTNVITFVARFVGPALEIIQ